MATELGSAYISVGLGTNTLSGDIKKAFGGAESSGRSAGAGAGKGFLTGFKGLVGAGAALVTAGAFAGFIAEAGQASDATDKFKATMNFAGLNTSAIDAATKAAKSYADQTVYDLPTIQNMLAQLASNGVKDYTGLTKAAGNLNAVAGGNAATFKSVAMVMTQTAGAGKLTTENWNQLSDAIPGAAGPLMKALEQAGAYTGNFRTAMEKGQISSDEFNAALMKLGTKPVAVEAAKSTATFEGAIGNLQATINSKLMGALDAIKPAATDAIGALSAGFSVAATFAGDFITEAGKVVAVLTTGDFKGPIFGLEEDSGFVDFLFSVRDGAIQFGTAVTNVASWVTTDMLPALQKFGGWLVENKDTIINVATGITALLMPAFVRLGITALISGAQQVTAWLMSSGGAIKAGIVYLAQSYLIIGRWVAMSAAAIVSGAQTVAIWALYATEAIKGAAVYAAQSARVAAAWVAMSAAAVISGIKTAAVWTAQIVATAVTSVVSFLVQTALVVGGWVAMATAATINAVKMAAGWVVGVVVPAVAAAATFLVGVATVVGGWIAMAAGAVVNAAILAASWLVAFWPVALIAAIVIALVALVIMNWETIRSTTVAVFGAIASFLSDTWNNIVNGVSSMIGNVVNFFTGLGDQIGGALAGAGKWLFDAGKNIVQGLFDGIKSLAGTIGNFFLSLLPGWIVEPFKIALGIHSPSRVFAGLGENIGQGLLNGVDGMQGKIDGTMSGLVTVPPVPKFGAPSFSPSSAGAAGGGSGSIVQNIHPAPGMSEETIGRVAANSLNYQLRMA